MLPRLAPSYKRLISPNRNSEPLPEHLGITRAILPHSLMRCNRNLSFHSCWTPTPHWSLNTAIWYNSSPLPLSARILRALPNPSNIRPCQKKHDIDISAARRICSTNLGGRGQPKTFLQLERGRVCRARGGAAASSACERINEAWRDEQTSTNSGVLLLLGSASDFSHSN